MKTRRVKNENTKQVQCQSSPFPFLKSAFHPPTPPPPNNKYCFADLSTGGFTQSQLSLHILSQIMWMSPRACKTLFDVSPKLC